eukprot:GGOE01003908.1.p1 GENE.GGOE01003908.1~~GGOE01003908.1.p1  ORF type:complete len:766 (-),score=131.78 GGOE01003908.1:239-2536(-)
MFLLLVVHLLAIFNVSIHALKLTRKITPDKSWILRANLHLPHDEKVVDLSTSLHPSTSHWTLNTGPSSHPSQTHLGYGVLIMGCTLCGLYLLKAAFHPFLKSQPQVAMFAATGDQEYQNMKVVDLKARLRELGEKVSGRKEDLIRRLREADASHQDQLAVKLTGSKPWQQEIEISDWNEVKEGHHQVISIAASNRGKRKRGRQPRGTVSPQPYVLEMQAESLPLSSETVVANFIELPVPPKRSRGRPRKQTAPDDTQVASLKNFTKIHNEAPPGTFHSPPLAVADAAVLMEALVQDGPPLQKAIAKTVLGALVDSIDGPINDWLYDKPGGMGPEFNGKRLLAVYAFAWKATRTPVVIDAQSIMTQVMYRCSDASGAEAAARFALFVIDSCDVKDRPITISQAVTWAAAMLQSPDLKARSIAALQLASFAVNAEAIKQIGSSPEIIDKLVALLKEPEQDVRLRGIHVLCRLATNASNKVAMMDAGVVPLLLDMVRNAEQNSMGSTVAATFAALSQSATDSVVVAMHKAVDPLISLLQSTERAAVHHGAALCLGALANTDVDQMVIGASGAIAPLIALLSPEDPQCQAAIVALRRLTQSDANRTTFVSTNGILPVMKLLRTEDLGVRINAVMTLTNVARKVPYNMLIAASGAVGPIVELFRTKLPRAINAATHALFALADELANHSLLVAEGAIPPLVYALQSGDPPSKAAAAATLALLARTSSVQGAIIEAGAVDALRQLARSNLEASRRAARAALALLGFNVQPD